MPPPSAAALAAKPASVPPPSALGIAPAAAAPAAEPAKKKKVSKQTVAYLPTPAATDASPPAIAVAPSAPEPIPPAAAPAPISPTAAPASEKKKVSKQTVAYIPGAEQPAIGGWMATPPPSHAAELAAMASEPATDPQAQPLPVREAAIAPVVIAPHDPPQPAPSTQPEPQSFTPQQPAPAQPSFATQPAQPFATQPAQPFATQHPAQPSFAPQPPASAQRAFAPLAQPVAPSTPPSQPPQVVLAPPSAASVADGADVLYARDGEPTPENPLAYRERTFVVAAGTSADAAEAILRHRFALLRDELASRPKGKLVNMAVFDHRWEGRPLRPPLATLQWKDWRGDPEVARPPQPVSAPPPSPPHAVLPVAPIAAPAAQRAPRQRLSTPGPDERLSAAFEQLQDLFFLATPLDGATFVLELLAELVPHEAGSVCLYDINSDELRFVALRGPGADERRGEAIPMGLGLLGAVARDFARPLLIEEVGQDPRFDPGVDGRVGLDPRTMAVFPIVHQGRLQAVLQLVNRVGQAQFGKSDANLLSYVGEKLGEFLHQSRLGAQERAAGKR
jgi:hypothetical protein